MTIKDIARLSGYGIGTVSRVINNHPDVSEKARKRILEVIAETNFQPNANARHLKMQSTDSIFIIVKGTYNALFADILEKMQTLLSKQEENAEVSYIDEDANEVLSAIELCKIRNPKGFIFLGGNLDYFRKDFHKISVPSILMTNDASEYKEKFPNLSSITTHDEMAAATMIDYLVSLGHKNIGLLGGNLSSTSEVSYRRITGCENYFKEHNIPFDLEKQFEPCRFSFNEGYIAVKKLLNRNPNTTAVFAMGDLIAMGAMRAIVDMGMKIPEDISVVGFDGIALSQYCIPRLTTIHQNTTQMAKHAINLMLYAIHYPQNAQFFEVIPFHLIEGESVQDISKK